MKRSHVLFTIAAGWLAFSLTPVLVSRAATSKTPSEPEMKQEQGRMEGGVRSQAEGQVTEQRKKIIEEAVSALQETRNALRALDENKPQDAIAALERATGKLNIVLAREPALALAPVEVAVITYDLYTTVDAIQKARKQAEDWIEDGQVQKARMLLRDLASEININVISLPLKTYPAAITAAASLIDKGRTDEAKDALHAALNTLVIVEHITPLPLVRADVKLAMAEQLAQKEGRSEEDSKRLTKLLNEAREQLKLAEALGYGNKKDYKIFYAEVDQIESKTKGGKSGKGFFSAVKEHLSDFRKDIFG